MSDSNYKPDGTGVVMGDRKAMPDRGTSTGMTGYSTDLGGQGIGVDDTRSMGKLSSTDSDPMAVDRATDPAVSKHTSLGGD